MKRREQAHYPRIHGLQYKLCVWLRANETGLVLFVHLSVRPFVKRVHMSTRLSGSATFWKEATLEFWALVSGEGLCFLQYFILFAILI